MKSTPITKESLVAYGFTDNTIGRDINDWHPDLMTKDLRAHDPDEDEDEKDEIFCLAYTLERNSEEFVLRLPNGCGTLYLGFKDIEHIEAFETAIGSHSPEW